MYKPFDLNGKVVVVVGGNKGIGYGIADALIQAGATVVIGGRTAEKNMEAVAELGNQSDYINVDATNEESVISFMDEVVSRHGRIDACFAVAGGATISPKPFDSTPLDYWTTDITTNLTSVYLCFREASKHMIRLGNGGSLVSISSIHAITDSTYVSAYATAKAALVGMTTSLCKKMGEFNIRINTIMSGFIETETTLKKLPPDYKEQVIRKSVFNRMGTVEDFGGLAVYLTSDASRWHTADTFLLDGGQSKTL